MLLAAHADAAGTAAIVNAVAKDANGIGYGGAAYAKGIRFAAVKKDANSPACCRRSRACAPTGTRTAATQAIVTSAGYFPTE